MPACKSGSTSGWTCGVVTADKVTESVNDNGELLDVYGFHFSAFLLSGDSGGPSCLATTRSAWIRTAT
ncbi:S1 family peptidase [Bifidobacterium bifidum]|uniref:S1 family peptidase n=1 Tax=Bifidobacterium bifidum TaxID=1681 RepID=UPI001E49499A|nr:S1 family peptidase [Bifidobacterium bifidum]